MFFRGQLDLHLVSADAQPMSDLAARCVPHSKALLCVSCWVQNRKPCLLPSLLYCANVEKNKKGEMYLEHFVSFPPSIGWLWVKKGFRNSSRGLV